MKENNSSCDECDGRGFFYEPQTDNLEEIHAVWEDMLRDEFDSKEIRNCRICDGSGVFI